MSASDDVTVRSWDVDIGEMVGVPLRGHTRRVTQVALSTDCKEIVPAS